jgi:hypothetical protein
MDMRGDPVNSERRGGVATVVVVAFVIGAAATLGSAGARANALERQWTRRVGAWATAVTTTPGGRSVVVGQDAGAAALVRVYSAVGELLWSRSWKPGPGGENCDEMTAAALAGDVAPDGTVYLGGWVSGTPVVGSWFLQSYSVDGVLQWTKLAADWRGCPYPGSAVEGVAATDHQVVIAGGINGCCDDPTTDDWLRAYSPIGERTWSYDFEAPRVKPRHLDLTADVAVGVDGSLYVVGAVNRQPGADVNRLDFDAVVQKVSAGGVLRWSRMFSDRGHDTDRSTSVDVRGSRLFVTAQLPRGWLGRFSLGGQLLRTWIWPRAWVSDVSIGPSLAAFVLHGGVTKIRPDGSIAWHRPVEGRSVSADRLGISTAGDRERLDGSYEGRIWRYRT